MIGMVLKGRYLVEERVGSGGMAEVYRGMDLNTERTVAIKVLRAEFSKDEEFVRRFQREAHAAAALNHQNLVGVHDLGDEDGIQFIVMDYVRGVTLKDVVRERGALPTELTVRFAHQLCNALAHAHQENIIHRDIKPQNIIIDKDGRAKLTDFGIARATTSHTVTLIDGSVMGSVHYFSPEQARGELAVEQSDIYSLGVVMYEMATGAVPFDGDTPVSIALAHLQEPPDDPRKHNDSLPVALCEVIAKAMAKDKADRYQSAEEMDEDIRLVLKHPEGGFVTKREIKENDPTRLVPVVGAETIRKQNTDPTPVVEDESEVITNTYTASAFDDPPRKHARTGRIMGVLAILLIIAASAGVVWLVLTMIEHFSSEDIIYVPDVVGKTQEVAAEALTDVGLVPQIQERYDMVYAKGVVVFQEPVAKSPVQPRSTVLLTISKGPTEIHTPGLYNLGEASALTIVEREGLVAEIIRGESNLPRGQVYAQEPQQGEILYNGDTIILYVSEPPIMRVVPDVIDMPLGDATETIKKEGLEVGQVLRQPASDVAPETVFRQTPEGGEDALDGSVVDLWISSAPMPEYRRQVSKTLMLPEGGADVRMVQTDESGKSITLIDQYYEGGEAPIEMDLESETVGTVTITYYIDGVQIDRERITFTEADLVVG